MSVLATLPAKGAATGAALGIKPRLLLLVSRQGWPWHRRPLCGSARGPASRGGGATTSSRLQFCQRCCKRLRQMQHRAAARPRTAAHAARVRGHIPLRAQLLESAQAGGWDQAGRCLRRQRHRTAWLGADSTTGVSCEPAGAGCDEQLPGVGQRQHPTMTINGQAQGGG